MSKARNLSKFKPSVDGLVESDDLIPNIAISGNATTASALAVSRTISISGDMTGSTSFDGSTDVTTTATLANTGVIAGTYTKFTVDSKGRATYGTSLSSLDVTTALGFAPYNSTNPNGYTSNAGTVTSVSGNGSYGGLTLSGTVTTSGSLTLGGTPTGTWPISVSGNAATATNSTNADFLPQHDTRASATTPQTINSGLRIDFKQNSTEGLSDGGTYFGQLTYRQYGGGSDWTGGASHQLGFTDNGNIWQRSGTGTTWGSWKKLIDSSNIGSYVPASFPSGTAMLFAQTSAPTGWTKQTTHNDKALRVVSGTAGSGGSVAFSTAFASKTPSGSVSNTTVTGSVSVSGSVSGTTLGSGEIPSHRHYAISNANVTVLWPPPTNINTGNYVAGSGVNRGYENYVLTASGSDANVGLTSATGGSGSHSHGFSGSGSMSTNAHSHTFAGNAIDLTVQYVDVIIATKD